jgi:hypothetical protein
VVRQVISKPLSKAFAGDSKGTYSAVKSTKVHKEKKDSWQLAVGKWEEKKKNGTNGKSPYEVWYDG